jgi:hypothetical protein
MGTQIAPGKSAAYRISVIIIPIHPARRLLTVIDTAIIPSARGKLEMWNRVAAQLEHGRAGI